MSFARIATIINNNVTTKKISTIFTFLIALTLVSFGAIATHASFNDSGSSAVTGQSGKMTFTVTRDSSNTFIYNSADPLMPNQTRTFSTTIKNTGTVPLKYFVMFQDPTSPYNLTTQLTIEVKVGTTSLYKGKVGQMATDMRNLAVGASEVISFTITWPYVANTNSNFQGTRLDNQVSFHALQV